MDTLDTEALEAELLSAKAELDMQQQVIVELWWYFISPLLYVSMIRNGSAATTSGNLSGNLCNTHLQPL
jgi:hypothetical protein